MQQWIRLEEVADVWHKSNYCVDFLVSAEIRAIDMDITGIDETIKQFTKEFGTDLPL